MSFRITLLTSIVCLTPMNLQQSCIADEKVELNTPKQIRTFFSKLAMTESDEQLIKDYMNWLKTSFGIVPRIRHGGTLPVHKGAQIRFDTDGLRLRNSDKSVTNPQSGRFVAGVDKKGIWHLVNNGDVIDYLVTATYTGDHVIIVDLEKDHISRIAVPK